VPSANPWETDVEVTSRVNTDVRRAPFGIAAPIAGSVTVVARRAAGLGSPVPALTPTGSAAR
jgi:hypothetical protein